MCSTGTVVDRPMRTGAGEDTEASEGESASTESNRAVSATVVARGPCTDMPNQPPSASRSAPGFSPTRPHIAAGRRTEPMPSVPWASGTRPAATAAALPPDDPPAA
ncbi:hypothetical protein DV36_03785 [Amycolatopsis mediterranei]|nr:hypothetical protein DV36_03785 [Amycolatopsis mediterranei]